MAKSKAAMARARDAEARARAGLAGKTAAETRRTATVEIESPYGEGSDRVTIVSDTVAWLAARGMIDDRQKAAAERYRRAHETVHAGMACILAKDVVDGPRRDGVSERRLEAGRVLNDASALLGPLGRVVQAVVGEGRSLDEIAAELHGTVGRGERTATSHMLRLGLRTLADAWDCEDRPQAIRSSYAEAARPSIGDATEAGLRELMRVAHGTLRRVYLA